MRLTIRRSILVAAFACALTGCTEDQPGSAAAPDAGGAPMKRDLQQVDGYLEKWDRFAEGENQLAVSLREEKAAFESALTRMLRANDKRAPARMVFYPVVQVGGSIPADSELGKACAAILGPDFTVTTTKEGERVYFGGDLYLWWEANRNKFEAYPLFDEWSNREFARAVVIPMFRSASKRD